MVAECRHASDVMSRGAGKQNDLDVGFSARGWLLLLINCPMWGPTEKHNNASPVTDNQ